MTPKTVAECDAALARVSDRIRLADERDDYATVVVAERHMEDLFELRAEIVRRDKAADPS